MTLTRLSLLRAELRRTSDLYRGRFFKRIHSTLFFIALFAAKQKSPPTQIYVPRGHFSIVYIFYYVLHPATEYSTQIVDFCSADALAAAQPVYSAAAYTVLIDKRIGGLPFLFKRYPKRGVRNHTFIINYSQIIDNSHNVDYNQEKPLKE